MSNYCHNIIIYKCFCRFTSRQLRAFDVVISSIFIIAKCDVSAEYSIAFEINDARNFRWHRYIFRKVHSIMQRDFLESVRPEKLITD